MYIIFAVLLASLAEYLMHRFYLHKNTTNKHILTHHVKYRGDSYVNSEAKLEEIISNPMYIFICSSLNVVLALLYKDAMLYFIGLFYLLFKEVVHFKFHTERDFLRTLNEHHKYHHANNEHNFGIGSVWWDYLFGSKKYRNFDGE